MPDPVNCLAFSHIEESETKTYIITLL